MDDVVAFLADRGAGEIEHPGGTLLAHLVRVADVLARWGAPATVVTAGLAHAVYGTDGFPRALCGPDERPTVAALLGAPAERIVHAYGLLDRRASYPTIDRRLVDRVTGEVTVPDAALTSALVEITFANELDVVAHSAELRARHGGALQDLFTRWASLASPASRAAAGV